MYWTRVNLFGFSEEPITDSAVVVTVSLSRVLYRLSFVSLLTSCFKFACYIIQYCSLQAIFQSKLETFLMSGF